MIINERNNRHKQALLVAEQMMTAARTAPKGKGFDIVEVAMITDEDIRTLSKEILRLYKENGMSFFLRDSENILSAEAIVLIGTRIKTHGLNCYYCGYATCAEKPAATPCAINTIDIGIAVGSACALAADMRVDSRVMFSAGYAARQLKLLGEDCHNIIAIPVGISSKNTFFDRKPNVTP